MKISDLIHSYSDILPEPSLRHAEVIRLKAPDYRPVVMAFNLADAMAGKASDITLEPFDTVRVFSRYDFEDPPQITVSGAVRDPGAAVADDQGSDEPRDPARVRCCASGNRQLHDRNQPCRPGAAQTRSRRLLAGVRPSPRSGSLRPGLSCSDAGGQRCGRSAARSRPGGRPACTRTGRLTR